MGYADQIFDLTGKVVVVTGGSRGLGKEIATAVARQGADVVIASRKLENCEQVADEIKQQTGRQTMSYGVHVGRWDDLEPFVDAVYDRFGKVDVLFNNAGMSPVYDKLTDVTEKLFDSVINLNFKGRFRLAGGELHERRYPTRRRRDVLAMAWDFTTEPEFQAKLDWANGFVEDKVYKVAVLWPHDNYKPTKDLRQEQKDVIQPLKDEVRKQGLWGCHLR